MAGFQAKTGVILAPGSGGSTVTLGFRPKAIVLWTSNATANNAWSSHLDLGLGFWVKGPSGAIRNQSQWVRSANGVNTSNAQSGLNAGRALQVRDWYVNALTDTATGFTVTYGSNPPTNTRLHYLAIGGDEVNAQILSWQPRSTMVAGQVVPVRGVGFRPVALFAISSIFGTIGGAASADHGLGFGVADAVKSQWSWAGTSKDGVNPIVTTRWWDEAAAVSAVTSGGVAAFRASVSAWQDDGFDLSILTAPTSVLEGNVYFLALSEVRAVALAQAKPVGTAPAAQTLSPGFSNPAVVLFGSAEVTAVGAGSSNRGTMGAADGTTISAAAWSDTTAAAPTTAKGLARSGDGAAIVKADNGAGTTEAVANVTALGTATTLSWTTNDAVATRFGAFLLGAAKNALSGVIGAGSAASATKLPSPTPLSGTVRAGSKAEGSLVPWAKFSGSVGAGSSASGSLKTGARLKGSVGAGSSASADRIRRSVTFTGTVQAGSSASGNLGRGFVVSGVVQAGSSAAAVKPLKTDTRLIGTIQAGSAADGALRIILPIVRQALPGEIAGTVNWHINPSVESGSAIGWDVAGSATGVVSTDDAWDGARSWKVVTSGAVGDGVRAVGVGGMGLSGDPRTVFGQLRVKGPAGTVLSAITRLHFRGLATQDSDPVTVTLTGAWDPIYTMPVVTASATALDQAEVIVTTTATGAVTLYADGAQLEEDHGAGATPWASGAYNADAGVWAGAAHNSVTIRQPIPVAITALGSGGFVVIESTLWRATSDNRWLEDLSEWVISGTVSCDAGRAETWSFDLSLMWEGWQKLTPFQDWLAPVLKVTYPNGDVYEGQLGLYLVGDSPVSVGEFARTVRVSAHDPLWLLGKQGFFAPVVVRPGIDRIRVVRETLDGAVLTDDDTGRRRYVIADSNKEFKKVREWPRKTSRLALCNEVLKGAGYYDLWTTKTGMITSRKRGESRLRNRQPVRLWAASAPSGYDFGTAIRRDTSLTSEVIGAVEIKPSESDMADEIAIVGDDPDLGRFYAKWTIRNKKNKRAAITDRGKVKRIPWPVLDDNATAAEVAGALADELSTLDTRISISVVPDPTIDFTHETVSLAIWDAFNREVAVGQWAVHAVRYGFTPSDALMELDLGKVSNADDQVQ
ncbi:MAG: hypothetical protein JSS40_08380 [Proteobacteria bacterium]|nr:hypothetical protein [Pseudomonadota bacterium]